MSILAVPGVVGSLVALNADARAYVSRNTIEGLSLGMSSVWTAGTSVLTISNSTVAHNVTAWSQSGAGAVIQSLGNNAIIDTAGATGTITPIEPSRVPWCTVERARERSVPLWANMCTSR